MKLRTFVLRNKKNKMNHKKNSKWPPFFDDVIKDFEIFDFFQKIPSVFKMQSQEKEKRLFNSVFIFLKIRP